VLIFTPGKPATLAFSLLTEAGELLVPTALRYRVLDEADTQLQAWTSTDLPAETGSETAAVTVIGALNILTPPATRGARVVELEIDSESGTVTLSQEYLLQGTTALAFGINSFLTYTAAIMVAADFVPMQLAGWTAAERATREQALIEAYGRVMRLPIVIEFDDSQSIVRDIGEDPWRLADLTAGQIATLDPKMLSALKTAQLVEANEIMVDDPIKAARREGVVSVTVGESSQFFGTSKPLDLGVSARAAAYLQRWLRIGARIARR